VVNCAGYTHVDNAEREIAAALAANTVGPAVLAAETSRWESVLIHISTDHVFAGTAGEPYREDDPTGPPNCYGRTKEQGEAWVRALQPRHYVVRTAGLFGSGGRNFVAAVLARAERGEPVRVVADQVCQRTYAPDLAGALWQLVRSEVPFGTYHLTNQGAGSWYEFAGDLVEAAGCDLRPTPVSSAAWGASAPRPAYSVLSDAKWRAAGLRPLRPLLEAVREYLCRRPREKAQ
jgi:dTDP-4-dehydrorhamnose reductase